MINKGVPNKRIKTSNELAIYDTEAQEWKCQICGKTEKPQDYTNMERHIIRHKEKERRKQKAQEEAQRQPLTEIQILRLETLGTQECETQEETRKHTRNQITRNTTNKHP